MSEKYHIGFTDIIQLKNRALTYEVVHICDASNGKVVAFATSPEIADKVVKALNTQGNL